jgi:DNA-binding PucR family transcriptional regulator
VAFTARAAEPGGAAVDAVELHRAEMLAMVSVHLTSYRHGALVCASGDRVYAVLPEAREPTALLAEVTETIARRTGVAVQAGAGSPVRDLGQIARSRAEADRVLDAMGAARRVATIADLRAEVLLDEVLARLAREPELRDPALEQLLAHDAEHGGTLAPTLLAYLDAMGDVRAVAAALHVHPNTVRHRVRRARAVAGLDLADPRQRLAWHLQLLLSTAEPGRRRG